MLVTSQRLTNKQTLKHTPIWYVFSEEVLILFPSVFFPLTSLATKLVLFLAPYLLLKATSSGFHLSQASMPEAGEVLMMSFTVRKNSCNMTQHSYFDSKYIKIFLKSQAKTINRCIYI